MKIQIGKNKTASTFLKCSNDAAANALCILHDYNNYMLYCMYNKLLNK